LDDYPTFSPFISKKLEADSLSVGALAVRFGATASNDTIFVGTGEPGGAGDAYFGVGILYSPNGGAPGTWSREGGTELEGRAIYRIVIDPDDPTKAYAATSVGLYQRVTSGIVPQWNPIKNDASGHPFTKDNGIASDLIVVGSGTSKRYYAAFDNDRIYSSPDGANNWTAIAGMSTVGRTVLAADENDTSVVYALDADGNLYRLESGSFQQVSGVPQALFSTPPPPPGWYAIALAVDPANANTIYLAGDYTEEMDDLNLSFYKGTITGTAGSYQLDPTWIGHGIHPDAHALAFATNPDGTHDGSNVWIGTDGGIFQSTMSGARGSFVAHNTGLAITQMTFMAQRSDTDATIFSGCQDNGNLRGWGEEAWFESPEGDGGGVAIDPNGQYRVMRQSTFSDLSISTDGGASGEWSDLVFPPTTSATQVDAALSESSSANFYAPIAVYPASVTSTLAVFGTYRLWLTCDWGSTWVTLPTGTNPYSSAIPDEAQDKLDGGSPPTPIVAIAFASSTRIFVVTSSSKSNSQVWRFDHNGTWAKTPITMAGLPSSYFITALAVEDPTIGSFYATLGRSTGDPNHVWYFDGTGWHKIGIDVVDVNGQPVDGGKLDLPAHAVVVDPANPQQFYVGTDVGCWKGHKTGSATWEWTIFSPGLPQAAITDIAIHARTRLLRVATHGRGIWEIPLDATSNADPDVYMRVNYADSGRIVNGARPSWVDGAQDPTAMGHNVFHWMSADIKVRRGSLTGLPALNTPPDYLDFSINIGDFIDPTTHIETADVLGTNRIFVEVHNRALTALAGSQVRVLLLLTAAAAGLPPLPANYASHINAGDTSVGWLAGTHWFFADPVIPYRTLPGPLDVRTPQVVEYQVNLAPLALLPSHDHVCAAAFVTTTLPSEQITSTSTNLDQVTMQDKHIVYRNLHLIPAIVLPPPPPPIGPPPPPIGPPAPPPIGPQPHFIHTPQTFLIDFHNATDTHANVDLVFQRPNFPGSFSLLLPTLDLSGPSAVVQHGWQAVEHSQLETTHRTHLENWLERIGEAQEQAAAIPEQKVLPVDIHDIKARKLDTLDRTRVYIADDTPLPTIAGVPIPAGSFITAAVTVQAPAEAQPGERFRFDVMQKRNGAIVGGCSYILVVTSGG
jgi:hypothetical protein